ncbi:MAG: PilZ domain-containing protein [Deltaproteobacteria bacterium]|nr:PilZ domain-containing protein [Deltaproteobacteria bacterium]
MASPSVLLVDDGELDDVRALLAQMGAAFVHYRGGQIPETVEPPQDLFIATSRRALLVESWPLEANPTKIAVVTEDSNTLRNLLRRNGFQLLIRRPVHPYALRLVLLRALYSGRERRVDPRLPIGHPVRYRTGLRSKRAWMADLSLRGCRLLLDDSPQAGSRLTLQLPSGVTDGRSLTLRGKVLRVSAAGSQSGGVRYAAAIHFEKLSMNAKRRIFQVLNDRAHGPAVLPEPLPQTETFEQPEIEQVDVTSSAHQQPIAGPATPDDRRKHERVVYEQEISIHGDEAESVLIGRDLSMGGMSIEPHASLKVNDTLELALYGEAGDDPFVVKARVVHREVGAALGLEFIDLDPGVAGRLDRLVAHLPAIEPLQDGESDAMGSIVSRILHHEG